MDNIMDIYNLRVIINMDYDNKLLVLFRPRNGARERQTRKNNFDG